jgi:hypothetical protein
MEWLMAAPLATLRQINQNVRSALVRFQPETQRCSAIAPRELSDLLAELIRARQCLETGKRPMAAETLDYRNEFAAQVREYRINLEKLKHILPDFQSRLLTEKARLQKAQLHAAAAAAWAGASEKTLLK